MNKEIFFEFLKPYLKKMRNNPLIDIDKITEYAHENADTIFMMMLYNNIELDFSTPTQIPITNP